MRNAAQSDDAPSDDAPYVSIVIPCLNEAKTLRDVIEKGTRAFESLGIRGEIVVADNGSSDGSVSIAEEMGARVVSVAERGYGSALRHGMAAARGRLIVMGDADDTYDFGEIGRFVERFQAGADLVMGTRLPPGTILPGANPWLHRNVGTPVLTFILNRLFGTRIRDVNCGLRAISNDTFRELDLRSEGMEFASEMLIKAAVMNLKVAEVPVTLHPDRRGRPPHLRRWRDGWRHLEFMLLHAPDQLLFIPGLVLLAIGLVVGVPVSLGPMRIGKLLFDYHYLLASGALVLIGLQGVLGAVAVRDVAKGRVLRPSAIASAIARWLDLRRGLLAAAIVFLLGFLLDATVLVTWIRSDFDALFEVRRSVAGLVLMAIGAEVGLLSFLHAALKRHA